jgi:hypothetical protein
MVIGLRDQASFVQLSPVLHLQQNPLMVMLELAQQQRLMVKHVIWHVTVVMFLLLDLWFEHLVLLEHGAQFQASFVQQLRQLQLPPMHHMFPASGIQTQSQSMVMLDLAPRQNSLVKPALWHAAVVTHLLLAV